MANNNDYLDIYVENEELEERLYDWQMNILPESVGIGDFSLNLFESILYVLGYRGTVDIDFAHVPDHPEILYVKMRDPILEVSREKIVVGYTDFGKGDEPVIYLEDKDEFYSFKCSLNEKEENMVLEVLQINIDREKAADK